MFFFRDFFIEYKFKFNLRICEFKSVNTRNRNFSHLYGKWYPLMMITFIATNRRGTYGLSLSLCYAQVPTYRVFQTNQFDNK